MQHISPNKSHRRKPPLTEPELVSQLNKLLSSLHIPLALILPTDLTPSLLLAILEGLIGSHIPVESGGSPATSKIQKVKIFLGILETDLLQMDVGLSKLNPRCLAEGRHEEIVFIAELLCWIGRRKKLISKTKNTIIANIPESPPISVAKKMQQVVLVNPGTFPLREVEDTIDVQPLSSPFELSDPLQPEGRSVSTLQPDDLSLLRSPKDSMAGEPDISVDGTVLSSVSDILGVQQSFSQILSATPRMEPLCIHQIPPPTPMSQTTPFLFSEGRIISSTPPTTPPRSHKNLHICPEHLLSPSCRCELVTSPVRSPPIRFAGYIQQVDEESEIASFELSRSRIDWSSSSTPTLQPSILGSQVCGFPQIRLNKTEFIRQS